MRSEPKWHEPATIRPSFYERKARVYRAWTGLRWMWCVTVPDVRWASGYEWCECATFDQAIRVLNVKIWQRSFAVHPWISAEYADSNWIAETPAK